METQSALAPPNHTLPLVMMHTQQQQQQQLQQQHLLLLHQQQQQQQTSQQHLTPPPQQIIAPQAFASPIVRPGVHMMPIMPIIAADHVNASLCTPVNSQAAAQLFYQQQLLQQQQLHIQLQQAQVQSQVQVQPSPPATVAATTAAPAVVSPPVQQQQQYPSPPQLASTTASLPPASISPAEMNAATVYNFPSLPTYLQAHLQLRKSNLRNGDVFFYAGDDLTADIDGVIGHLRPGSPTLSPPLSPTDFQLNNVTEADEPLFAYEARESVEFPVPNSPPSDTELEDRLLKPSSDKINNDTSFNKPIFIPLAPLLAIIPDTTNGEMMNDNVNQNGKTALQTLSRHLCSGVLPTPPEMARASMSFDTETSSVTITATTSSNNSSDTTADVDVTTSGSRKRKASTIVSSIERSPVKSSPSRKRRANSIISTDSNGHSASSTSTSTSTVATTTAAPSSTPSMHHRKKLNKPAPIVIKTETPELSPSLVTHDDRKPASPRKTQRPTVFEQLTEASVDWCRYCGTTEGVNWRPGPWGKRTLCNKHGCDYKGYGFACKLPRLNLTAYQRESIHDRERPVLQLFCTVCHSDGSWCNNVLVSCEGCPKSYHQHCYTGGISDEEIKPSSGSWYCTPNCEENARKRRIIVELPRKRLPLMRSPKDDDITDTADCMVSMRRGSSVSLSEDGGSPRIRNHLTTPPLPVGMRARSYSATTAAAMSSRRTARARPRLFYGEVDMEEDDTNTSATSTTNNNTRSTPLSAGNDGALSCRSLLEEQFRFSTSSLNSNNTGTSGSRHSPRLARTTMQSTLIDNNNNNDDDVEKRVHHRENDHVAEVDDDDDDDEEDVAAARVLVDEDEDEDETEEHDGAIIGWS